MLKAKATTLKRLAIAGGLIVAAAALFGFAAPAFQTWREDAPLRDVHISYVQLPCTAMTSAADCPSYRVDVFGDGTVVYQGGSGTHIKGSYIYHVPAEDIRDFARDFGVSSFWTQPIASGPNAKGGDCVVVLHTGKETRRNGCWRWQPGTDQALNDPSVADSVAQLEALTRAHSLIRADAGTDALMRQAKPFKVRKDNL